MYVPENKPHEIINNSFALLCWSPVSFAYMPNSCSLIWVLNGVERNDPLPCSQELTTGHYREPTEFGLHIHTVFLQDPF
jgi:hypothetical protein